MFYCDDCECPLPTDEGTCADCDEAITQEGIDLAAQARFERLERMRAMPSHIRSLVHAGVPLKGLLLSTDCFCTTKCHHPFEHGDLVSAAFDALSDDEKMALNKASSKLPTAHRLRITALRHEALRDVPPAISWRLERYAWPT